VVAEGGDHRVRPALAVPGEGVEEEHRGLVEEEAGLGGRGADDVAGQGDERRRRSVVGDGGFEVRGEHRGAAGRLAVEVLAGRELAVEVVDSEDPDVHRPGRPGRLIGECDEEEDDADEEDGADDGLLPGGSAAEEGDGRHLKECCRGLDKKEGVECEVAHYAKVTMIYNDTNGTP